jgi:hypothetical protein
MDRLELTMLLTRWKTDNCDSDIALRTLVAMHLRYRAKTIRVQLKFSIRAIRIACNPLVINYLPDLDGGSDRAVPVLLLRFRAACRERYSGPWRKQPDGTGGAPRPVTAKP